MADYELQLLQSNCRKDPDSYRDDFLTQFKQYQALVSSTELRPSLESKPLEHLSSFLAHVSLVFPVEGKQAGADHVRLLKEFGSSLDVDLRRALVRSLTIMYRKGSVPIDILIPTLFQLLNCKDKELRKSISTNVVSSLKYAKKKQRNDQVEKVLQKYMYSTIENGDTVLVKRCLNVSIELFRKGIWNDHRTANVIAAAVFHPSPEVMVIAARFVLDSDKKRDEAEGDENSDSEEESEDDFHDESMNKRAKEMWKTYNMTGKKNSRKTARVQRSMKKMSKKKRSNNVGAKAGMKANPFSALMLINNPQEYTERLFTDLQGRRRNVKFDGRLLLMNLISRLISTHELFVLNLYPFLQRYLQPHQERVTLILSFLAQACHSLVPPDVLHPIIRTLADNFVSDRCSEEMISVGLNSIREICARVPLAVENESDDTNDIDRRAALLRDLVGYKSHRDKGVNMAARSLLQLYREVNPSLLLKKDRGKSAAQNGAELDIRYGAINSRSEIEGLELLQESSSSDSEMEAGDEDNAGAEAAYEENEAMDSDGDPEEDEHPENKSGEDESEGDEAGELDSEEADSDAGSVEEDEEQKQERQQPLDDETRSHAQETGTERVLDDEDFKRIRRKMAEKDLESALGDKRARTDQAVALEDIESYRKKKKRTLEERLETVRAGREGREKFGSAKGRKDKGGGTSNKVKQKKKQTSMILHKVRRKSKSKGGKQPRKKRR